MNKNKSSNVVFHDDVITNKSDEDEYSTADEEEEQQAIGVNESTTRDTIQLLVLRQKIELSNELRRLQFSSRSVSGTQSRRVLEDFFTQHQSNEASSFRTSLVQNEIESLNTQQRVSSILNTSRQLLENSLRSRRPHSTPVPPAPALVNIQHQPISVDQQQARNATFRQQTTPTLNTYARETQFQRRVQALQASIEHLRREQIIEEIGELVHQQLVTQALDSQFRTTLERRIGERLRATNTAAREHNRTREYIRQLTRRQTSQIERNDFTHLGIYRTTQSNNNIHTTLPPPTHEDEWQQNAARTNSNELRALRVELNELKNLLKLSFELQLDTQRSYKQEISGLLNEYRDNHSQIASQRSFTSRPVNEGVCLICTEAQVDTVLYTCGHMCTCYMCSMNLKEKNHTCPMCRAPIKDIIRTYKCL